MTNAMKLAVFVLLTFVLTVSTALAASLKTAIYEASYEEMTLMSITLNADGRDFSKAIYRLKRI